MKQRAVVFSPEAVDDLTNLYNWVAKVTNERTSLIYIERLEVFCRNLSTASERGTLRDDIRPSLRIVGFEQRVTIAFHVDEAKVIILRLFYGGQDWERRL